MHSPSMLRRFICINAAASLSVAPSSSSSSSAAASASITFKKKSLVFLGSPQVTATVLDDLFNASAAPSSSFEIAAFVTQPPSRRDGQKDDALIGIHDQSQRSFNARSKPVKVLVNSGQCRSTINGSGRIVTGQTDTYKSRFTILNGGELDFNKSETLAASPPHAPPSTETKDDTGRLGTMVCYLNSEVAIRPSVFSGTVNIHPSLLPLYRGAAPVQRALQDGVKETGVSLVFTIRALDAGPVIAREKVEVDDQIKVRAFAGWPGTRAKVLVVDDKSSNHNTLELKIITTRVGPDDKIQGNDVNDITFVDDALVFPCGGHTTLEVLEVQLPGKKVTTAAAFWNGLRG
ncbi:hypothetical protein F3Y22_tig00110213pilonHSYRG00376 [Hibiscus syriacus]|uniref:Methionyl-tRNA formyltransferase n=1 Tax=Hibiscus syriacus TaxID=106335 RepID=A0A6A3B924_HIBSY|nr:hypothetical protein F3Y22_tig00110213pilonHSYRG00376 [Hibiscus syriacus]